MSTVAVVLAGGRGTRSADPSTPKLAQVIGGRSLLEWHALLLADSEVDSMVVVAGHLGDAVQDLSDALAAARPSIRVIHETEQRGTVPALALAAQHTDAEEFLVVLGDILMAFPVEDFLRQWRESGRSVAVATHPSTHPEDSDGVFADSHGAVRVIGKSTDRSTIPNLSSTGLFAITREGVNRYRTFRDFGSDVLTAAAADEELFAWVSSHYFKDTGTARRLDHARVDVASGSFGRRGTSRPRPAVFLDRDGVINPAAPEVYRAEHYRLNEGVGRAIARANRLGIPVFVVTNQPGLAKGFMTFAEHDAIRARMDRLLAADGAFVDDYAFCPHHPDRGFAGEVEALKGPCECRKPGAAMATDLARRHRIDLSHSVMVGDTALDQGFARAAGLDFIHVADSCTLTDPHECRAAAHEAIEQAIEVIPC